VVRTGDLSPNHRVSTGKQGRSGLGIEAQRQAVNGEACGPMPSSSRIVPVLLKLGQQAPLVESYAARFLLAMG
jgi:hypothetical protein